MHGNSKVGHMLVACVISISFSIFAGTVDAAKEKPDIQQMIQRMESHWILVISEKDPKKRAKLIREHRQMMQEISKKMGMGDHHRGMGHHAGGQHHMRNSMHMHYMMMDMIER